jgi:biotin/methionine sulfoxide reductase
MEAWSLPRLVTQAATNDETFNGRSQLTIGTDNR